MADLPLLAARLFNHPHFCEPQYAEVVATALAHRLQIDPFLARARSDDKDDEGVPLVQRSARSPYLTKEGVYVLPIVGGLYHRGDSLDAVSGAQSYTHLNNQLLAALDNKDVRGILLDIDSPGGQAAGCFEFADTILEARKQKSIRAIANASAFSAAYAIGCSADKLYITPSGDVGSIGVIYMHRDISKMLDEAGMKVTLIFAGKHKADGNPYEPLPVEVRDAIKAEVEAARTDFINVVAARRSSMSVKQIRDTEARTYRAQDAVEMGLADEVMPFAKALTVFTKDLQPKMQSYAISYEKGGHSAMTTTVEDKSAAGPTRIEGLDAALTRAHDDGKAAARAEYEQKVIDSYKQGRTDAATILGHEAAQDRHSAAVKFAGNAKFSVDEAVELLATVPADGASGKSFQAKLVNNDPKVPAGKENVGGDVVGDFQSNVDAHVKRMLAVAK